MIIKGFQKTSLIDYPGKICSIIFLPKCNFRCSYCHNPELVLNKDMPEIKKDDVLKILEERRGFIEGVTITGGEPTLHKDLPEFIREIKKLGLLVKLDTNGTNPEMLNSLLKSDLINFVSMDIKNSFERYKEIVNTEVNLEYLKKSIKIIIESGIDHEFRTTVLPKLHNKKNLIDIAKYLRGAKRYVLQQFFPAEKMLDEKFVKEKKYSKEELEEIKKECSKYIKTEIRNL